MNQTAVSQNSHLPATGGVILINKPQGLSSFGAVKTVSRITGIRKAGHAGTLDPMATGLLVVCLGRATRITRFIMEGVKEYQGEMRLGVTTDTYDSQGKVVCNRELPDTLNMDAIQSAASALSGRLMQAPPPFSAAKHKGVPLYRLARRGEMVHKDPREIFVYEFRVQDAALPQVRFTISCSRGTYVRSLCHELGEMLGCGAHMTSLERTRCGDLLLSRAFTLDRLEDEVNRGGLSQVLISVNQALSHLPAVNVDHAQTVRLRYGQGLCFDEFKEAVQRSVPQFVPEQVSLVRIVTAGEAGEELVAVARPWSDERGQLVTEKIWI